MQLHSIWAKLSAIFMDEITVRVPATSANLGPGFDCLGVALDLHIRVTVEVPKHLTHAQREALELFAKTCDESTHPEGRSFLEKARKLFQS